MNKKINYIFTQMGNKFSSEFDINQLKIKVKDFIRNNEEAIRKKYTNPKNQKQVISYSILDNGIKNVELKELPLEDYVIQWSISGGNKINTTKVQLTFFNLGSFLGANGFLYSISVFYFYFIQLNTNRDKKYIREDIINCLKYIDSGDIMNLKKIFKTDIDIETLKIIKSAKIYLINIFKELIDEEIYEIIINQNKTYKKIWSFCKNGAKTIVCAIVWALTLSYYNLFRNRNGDSVKSKNKYNRKKILENIITIISKKNNNFFEKNNLFIIAVDDCTQRGKNNGGTFFGDYMEGLGENLGMAKRLIENDLKKKKTDGFTTTINEEKNLYNFYNDKINEIKNFFQKNERTINNINNGIDISPKDEKRLKRDLKDINERDKSPIMYYGKKNVTSNEVNEEDEENEKDEEDEENEEEKEKLVEEFENEIHNNPSISCLKKVEEEEKNEKLLCDNLLE